MSKSGSHLLSDQEQYFQKAMIESHYIETYCDVSEEEYWCELGIGQTGRAIRIIRNLKRWEGYGTVGAKEKIIDALLTAEKSFLTGIGRSPTGHRSMYWQLHVRSFRLLIETNGMEHLCRGEINQRNRISENSCEENDIYHQVAIDSFLVMGWLRMAANDEEKILRQKELNGRLFQAMQSFKNAVMNRSFSPNINFALATIIADFLPSSSVNYQSMIIDTLNQACEEARALIRENIGIFSNTQFQMTVQSPHEFIRFCTDLRDEIKNGLNGIKLMYYFLDTPLEQGPILSDNQSLNIN